MSDLVVLDGGLGTELEARGHDLTDPLWSARLLRDDPGAIRAVHADYVAAGADCVIAATYQATLDRLPAALFARAVELGREAGARLVAASVGPYGGARADGSEFTGDYDLDEQGLYEWHRERFAVLANAGADLLACETIPSYAECCALARLLEETSGAKAWFSFTCRDERHIADGTPIAACVARLGNVAAIGVNCTAPRHVPALLAALRTVTDRPLVAYPNSGERYEAGVWTGDRDPIDFATAARTWVAAGATWIGGCCRTRPAHIAALRSALR